MHAVIDPTFAFTLFSVSIINGKPIQTLFDDVTAAGSTDSTGRIDVLEVVGTVAVVHAILTDYHGGNYVDYHTPLKGEDGWKIAAKVFTEA